MSLFPLACPKEEGQRLRPPALATKICGLKSWLCHSLVCSLDRFLSPLRLGFLFCNGNVKGSQGPFCQLRVSLPLRDRGVAACRRFRDPMEFSGRR